MITGIASMRTRYIYLSLFMMLIFSEGQLLAQHLQYQDVVHQAIEYRKTQHATNTILWNREQFFANIDKYSIDSVKERLIIYSGKYIVTYNIKILGTYKLQDSSFTWYQQTVSSSPANRLFSIAGINKWNISNAGTMKYTPDSVYKLISLAFYLDSANGVQLLVTDSGKSRLYLCFYGVEVYDKTTKQVQKVASKKQYQLVTVPALISYCKQYVEEYDANEKKYHQLYYQFNEDWKYHDTMFANRISISNKYWDTTSSQYKFFKKNRIQAYTMDNIVNWRVIEVDKERYVLYDEKQGDDIIYKTYIFKLCRANGEYRICDEYISFL